MSDSKNGSSNNLNESNMPLLDDVCISDFTNGAKFLFWKSHPQFHGHTFDKETFKRVIFLRMLPKLVQT